MRLSVKSIFYRLFLSYSAIGTLPLAAAALVILVWGNMLVVRFVQTMGMNYTRLVAEEIDETVERFTEIGRRLAGNPAVLQALREGGMDPQLELELYQSMFQEIRGYLSVVEVHLTSFDGVMKYTTTEFPRRYDLTNHQVRESFLNGEHQQGPQILLAPGPGSEGTQAAFSIWFMVENGLLFIDVRTQALETPYQASTSSRLFLVNRRQFSSLNLIQPHDPASFSENPELGIVFTQELSLQPSPDQLVHRRDLRAQDLSVILATDLSSYFDTLNQVLLLALALVTALLAITLLI